MSQLKSLEAFRPAYHFTPPSNWMNDPNGMVYYKGEYHLFYQHHPDGLTWGPMHWGHAVSRDLVHWHHRPIALAPDEHGTIFSGSVVVDWHDTTGFFDGGSGLVAIFTHNDENQAAGNLRQRQSLAYSKDEGRTWMKYEGNPVLAEPLPDFRDPKVMWHESSSRWVMVVAAGDHVRLYVSPNLIEWSLTGTFGAKDGSHEGVWECPDLFELPVGESGERKWVLIVSIGDHPDYPEGSRTQYFIGEFDGRTFSNDHSPETVLWLDYGRDNYAGVTWSDVPEEDGRRLFIGWMSNWKYANLTPTPGWRGAMTVPRELALRRGEDGIRLFQRPVRELERLRRDGKQWRDVRVGPEHPFAPAVPLEQMDIRAVLRPGNAVETGIRLRSSNGGHTTIGYDSRNQVLFIDRSGSGLTDFHPQFACRHETELRLDNGLVELRILVDRCSVEVFANDGQIAMTDLVFPEGNVLGVEGYAAGGQTKFEYLEIFNMNLLNDEA